MSYHSPELPSLTDYVNGGRTPSTLGTRTSLASRTRSRMPSMPGMSVGKSVNIDPGLQAPEKPTITTEELGLVTEAEKKRKGYLSTYLEGQTPMNKLSNFLGGGSF